MKFKQDGLIFKAGKGFASAEKDGELLWITSGVFVSKKPTREAVLMMHRLFQSGDFDRCWMEADD